MRTMLNISVVTLLLAAASRECCALQHNVEVSKERAKELGVTLRSNVDGENGVKVWIEFEPKGDLKEFSHVTVDISSGGKRLVSAPLLTGRPSPERVAVHFSADPTLLPSSVLTIVVNAGERTRIGYQFQVKDFVEPQKSR